MIHNLQFKYENLMGEWFDLDFRLREIIIPTFQMLCYNQNQPTLVVTSIHRKDGVHSTWRAVDIRNPWKADIQRAEELGEWINKRFSYGLTSDGRPTNVCIVGKFDPKGTHVDHFHFQVPGPYHRDGALSTREVVVA